MAPQPRRNAKAFIPAALLAAALFAGGCLGAAPDPVERAPAGTAQVEIVVAGARVTATRIAPARPGAQIQAPRAGQALRWELRDGGELVASGEIADPRVVRAEFDEGGHAHGGEGRTAAGVATLIVPDVGGDLTLLEPDAAGGFREIGSADLPIAATDTSQAALIDPSTDILGEPVAVVDHGDPAQRANVLIVPEGYTEAQMEQFHADVDAMLATVASVGVYNAYWDAFNFYRQDVRSAEPGIADPALGSDPVTAFEMTFGVDGTAVPRRCVFYDFGIEEKILASLQTAKAKVNADVIVFLVNAEEYGGCAAPWAKTLTVTKNGSSPLILAHELGHALFNLADEYGGGVCEAPDVTGANVSSRLDALPWADMLTTGELPTPASAAAGTIGAFEGGSYCDNGVYRPQHTCLMRQLDAEMCPVCEREVQRFFQARGYGGGGAPPPGGGGQPQGAELTISNATGAGLFARCPNEVGEGCSDWTYFYPGDTLRIQTNAPDLSFTIDNSTVGAVDVLYSWRVVTPAGKEATVYANESDPLSPP